MKRFLLIFLILNSFFATSQSTDSMFHSIYFKKFYNGSSIHLVMKCDENHSSSINSDIVIYSYDNQDCKNQTYLLKRKKDLTWVYRDAELRIELEMKYESSSILLPSVLTIRSRERVCLITNYIKYF